MLDEPVRHPECLDLRPLGHRLFYQRQCPGPEAAAYHVLFHGDGPARLRDAVEYQLLVQRVYESGVEDRAFHALGGQGIRRIQCRIHHRADGDDGQVLAFPELFARAYLHEAQVRRQGHAVSRAPRVPQGRRALVLDCGVEEVLELVLVLRRGHYNVRQRTRKGYVEDALVGPAVLTDQPRPVHPDYYGQVLEAYVVEDLVVGPLQERGIDGHHRLQAPSGHSGGHRDRVLLRHPHVEDPFGEPFLHLLQPRALQHGRADPDHRRVGLHHLFHRVREHLGVGRRARARSYGGTRLMELDRVHFRGLVAPALVGDHVHQGWLVMIFHRVPQDVFQLFDVVAVNGAYVAKAHLFPQQVGDDDPFQTGLDAPGQSPYQLALGKGLGQVASALHQGPVVGVQGDPVSPVGEPPDVLRDRHPVVVQDDHQVLGLLLGYVVQPFVAEPRGQRPIPHHSDNVTVLVGEGQSRRHARRRRETGPRMPRPEYVVRALRDLCEAGVPALRPNLLEAVLASSDQLVRVALVARVPNYLILRAVQDSMQGQGKLYDAQVGRHVAPVPAHHPDDGLPDLLCQGVQFRVG